ncbi:MAG: glycosyltransferase family 2 protein [Gammaproteobacteria bacterium]|nr:MAG: glycosyltransferase family 2 protein [Gammaproteobacteria bacterium]
MYNAVMASYSRDTSMERRSNPDIGDRRLRVAVLIPCYNEAATIGAVVRDFHAALPDAAIYVYDNNSTDDTIEVATAAGALIRREHLQGKGHVVRRMFADIEADIYVLVDGDDTYEAAAAPQLVAHVLENGLDLLTAKRVPTSGEAYRFGHQFGNRLLTKLVAGSFGSRVSDMLSGYRVLSRRFVKSFPILTGGFEIETELTVHALELGMPQDEVETVYKERPEGSDSKLSTYRDGARILLTILVLLKEERPLAVFSVLFALLFTTSVVLAWPIVVTFLETGLVPRVPTAILSTGLMMLAFLSLASGMILDTVTRGRRELKRLSYLRSPGPDARRFGE